MTIVFIVVYVCALTACALAPKARHRVVMLIIMGVLTYFVCSSIIAAHHKVGDAMFRYQYMNPLQTLLSSTRDDFRCGRTNEAITKIDSVLEASRDMWLLQTNVTLRTINERLNVSEHLPGT